MRPPTCRSRLLQLQVFYMDMYTINIPLTCPPGVEKPTANNLVPKLPIIDHNNNNNDNMHSFVHISPYPPPTDHSSIAATILPTLIPFVRALTNPWSRPHAITGSGWGARGARIAILDVDAVVGTSNSMCSAVRAAAIGDGGFHVGWYMGLKLLLRGSVVVQMGLGE